MSNVRLGLLGALLLATLIACIGDSSPDLPVNGAETPSSQDTVTQAATPDWSPTPLAVGHAGPPASATPGSTSTPPTLAQAESTPRPTAQPAEASATPTATGYPPTQQTAPTVVPAATLEPSPSPVDDTPTPSPTGASQPAGAPQPAVPTGDRPVIVLDPGHDRTTPGALGIEYQVNLAAAYVAKAALEEAGYRVYLTREDNDTVMVDDPALLPPNASSMHPGYSHAYAHASKALGFEPDMVIILHFNGHPNPAVGGIEVYYCEMGGAQNLEMAEIMAEELLVAVRSLGHEPQHVFVREDLTVARGNRHFPSMGNVYDPPTTWVRNRYAGIPVVLTEPLYMTNAVELALIEQPETHEAIAQAYVRAANRWFGR
jgi:N-acetylmuramoyl-L-alanine amidase